MLAEAAAEAATTSPTLRVETSLVAGAAATRLIAASREAALLRSATKDVRDFNGPLLGSVVTSVMSHAACPVVVVPRKAVLTGPVLVGMDGPQRTQHMLEAAFSAAQRLSTGACGRWMPYRAALRRSIGLRSKGEACCALRAPRRPRRHFSSAPRLLPALRRQARRTPVVLAATLAWDDLHAGDTPNLDELLDDSAVASLSVRDVEPRTDAADGYATINAGTRARVWPGAGRCSSPRRTSSACPPVRCSGATPGRNPAPGW